MSCSGVSTVDIKERLRYASSVAKTPTITNAVKHDTGKPRMELLPTGPLKEMAKVLGAGASKYGDWNWTGGFEWSRLYGAALRHLMAHKAGEDTDDETGLSHLAHAGCCILFLLAHEMYGLGVDDRRTL